jgi:hypothetical protein
MEIYLKKITNLNREIPFRLLGPGKRVGKILKIKKHTHSGNIDVASV